MISGTLDIVCAPKLRIKIRNAAGMELKIDAVVDTGFNSFLSVPPYVASALGLSLGSSGFALLSDGSRCNYRYCDVQLEWDGVYRDVVASVIGGICLIGMRLLRGHQLRIDVAPFGKIEIEPLPISPPN